MHTPSSIADGKAPSSHQWPKTNEKGRPEGAHARRQRQNRKRDLAWLRGVRIESFPSRTIQDWETWRERRTFVVASWSLPKRANKERRARTFCCPRSVGLRVLT